MKGMSTPEQIEALEEALATPFTSITTEGGSTSLRSADETIKAIEYGKAASEGGGVKTALFRMGHARFKVPPCRR
jgi:hypothetical protein